MGPSKLRQAIGAVKDKTSIGLAKVGSSASLADLDVAIVKATRHEEYPPEERHVREVLNLTTYSRAFISECVSTVSRRLSRTRNWVVALKALMLIQRLLADGDPAYEQEIFFATRRGTRLLNLSDFRDSSGRSNAWDFSAFVRTYALYLDEQLEFRMQGRRGKRVGYGYQSRVEEEEAAAVAVAMAMVVRGTPLREMKVDLIFSRVHHLMQLLERFLACRPTGAARENRIVLVALYPIVKESFAICHHIAEILGVLIDRFMNLEVPEMVRIHEIFCRVAKQYDELDDFYGWSRSVGIARSSEYPDVEKISQKKLDMMDEYIHEKAAANNAPNNHLQIFAESPLPEEEIPTEEDANQIKALPPPEDFAVEEEEEEEEVVEESVEKGPESDLGDLLNLGEGLPTEEEHGDRLALALFSGEPATDAAPETTSSPWEAFAADGDWETALVQSAGHLSNQKPSLPGGFTNLMLDGMYRQAEANLAAAQYGVVTTGSASSVAFGSAGSPATLALPAPPSSENSNSNSADPFAASLGFAAPPYVQMSEMEKKQRLMVEEQLMWQQYARDGLQGHVGLANVQQ
ncbi:hypothetical protein M569_08691, partial [Genlisea aurea]